MSSRQRRLLALAVFVICFLIYLPFDLPTVGNASDNYWYVPTSISLLHQGNLDLSEYENLIENRSGYGIVRYRGVPYNIFPFGTSLITLPLVVMGEFIFHNKDEVARFFAIAALSAKILAALTAAFLFLTALRLTNRIGLSLLLTFVFAFATSQFSLHAGGLWSHNTALLLLTIALWILAGREERIYLAALPLVLSFIARPTMAIHILLISAYVFLYYRPQFTRYALLAALIGVLFCLFNYHIFGRPMPPYYGTNRLDFRHFGEALMGNLASPNRGLFIFTPIFFGSIYGMYWAFKNQNGVRFYRLLSLMIVLHWILISTFSHWWAGATIGPRFFCDMLSVLVLLLIPAALQLSHHRLLYPAAVIALLWSFFVQVHAVTSSQVYRWNFTPVRLSADPGRIWDWKDMQIFRTALPQSAVKNLPYSFRIFEDDRLVARVMKADISELANAEVRIDRKKYKAILLSDLLERYHVRKGDVIISGEDVETTVEWNETAQIYIYFVQGRVAKIYCDCSKEFPPFIESITVS